MGKVTLQGELRMEIVLVMINKVKLKKQMKLSNPRLNTVINHFSPGDIHYTGWWEVLLHSVSQGPGGNPTITELHLWDSSSFITMTGNNIVVTHRPDLVYGPT